MSWPWTLTAGRPIQQLMESRTEWVGSATELLETLASMVSEQARKGKGWPSAPNKLTGPLKRLIPNLRAAASSSSFQSQRSLDSAGRDDYQKDGN